MARSLHRSPNRRLPFGLKRCATVFLRRSPPIARPALAISSRTAQVMTHEGKKWFGRAHELRILRWDTLFMLLRERWRNALTAVGWACHRMWLTHPLRRVVRSWSTAAQVLAVRHHGRSARRVLVLTRDAARARLGFDALALERPAAPRADAANGFGLPPVRKRLAQPATTGEEGAAATADDGTATGVEPRSLTVFASVAEVVRRNAANADPNEWRVVERRTPPRAPSAEELAETENMLQLARAAYWQTKGLMDSGPG